MLSRLRHRTIKSTNYQYRSIHLCRSRDHILDVIRMTRTVNMCIMALLRLIFNMRGVDRYPTLPLLRGIIYTIKRPLIR